MWFVATNFMGSRWKQNYNIELQQLKLEGRVLKLLKYLNTSRKGLFTTEAELAELYVYVCMYVCICIYLLHWIYIYVYISWVIL